MINGLSQTPGLANRRLKVSSSASGSTGGDVGTGANYSHSASVASYFTPDAVDMNAAVSVAVASSSTGSGSWSATYTGPGAPTGYTVSGTGYHASLSVAVVFETIKVYGTFYSKWRTVLTAIKLYVDGTLNHTFGGYDHITDALGPSWLDLWGCFAVMSGSRSASRTGLPGTMPATYEYWAQCDQTIEGMWEDQIDGSWIGHPVALIGDSVPSTGGTCPFGLSLGTVSGSSQNGLTITGKAYSKVKREFFRTDSITECVNEYWTTPYDEGEDPVLIKSCPGFVSPAANYTWYKTTTESEAKGGSVWCIPNLEATIERFNTDYSELVQRLGLPKTTVLRSHSCSKDGVTTSANVESEVHPRHTAMLSTVGASAHTIEAPLSETVYAPMIETASKSKTYSFSGTGPSVVTCISDPACTPPGPWGLISYIVTPPTPELDPEIESASCTFPYDVDDAGDNTYINCYLYHNEPIARYVNFWASRHWLYWPYFPQEKDPETGTPDSTDWLVDSALVSTQEYWDAARTQWIHHPDLPSGEDRKTRNSLVTFCGYQSGHGPFFAAFVHGSVESSWLGISRWVTQELDLPTSLQYTSASSPLWTLTDCTGVYGTDLVLTPDSGKTTIKAKLALGSWGNELYMYPHIAHQLKPNWSTTNVTAVRVYLRSIDGSSRVLLENTAGDGFTTRNVIYDKPHGTDTKYAGSHAQDMGCGIVTDFGTDLKPAGISLATMSDAERATVYMLAGTGTYEYLEFEIDCTGPVTLNYPIFYATKSGWTVICENGHHQILLRDDGPGIRFGQLTFNLGNSLINPPGVKDFPGKMSIVDWLCFKRALCGADPTAGVTTELSTLFDSYEGQSVQNGSATCYAFLLPIGGNVCAALVNTYSETPPLPHFPRKKRDASTWLESGDYGLWAYEWAQEPRYLVNGGPNHLHLSVGGTVWTSASSILIDGWKISEHSHAVDNTESGAKIVGGTQELAEVRPWWGWFWAFVEQIASTGDVANTHSALNQFIKAIASADGVYVRSSKYGDPTLGWWKSSTPVTDPMSYVCLVADGPDNSVLLLASDGSTCLRKRTFDLGATWLSETPMTGVLYERGDESPMLFSTIVGPVESTMTIKGQIKGPHESAYGTAFTVKTNTGANLVLEETPIDVHYSEDDEALILSCKASGETEFGEWVSWDHGKTFKKV